MIRIHKSKVKALIRRGETWQGYIAPSNVNAFHINTGWSSGMAVTFASLDEMEKTLANYASYNCNPELGQRVVFWQEESAPTRKTLIAPEIGDQWTEENLGIAQDWLVANRAVYQQAFDCLNAGEELLWARATLDTYNAVWKEWGDKSPAWRGGQK